MNFTHHYLRENFYTLNERYIHNNPDLVPLLLKIKPDVVITDGFNPTHLYAFITACARGWPHVAMTDGTWRSEQALSFKHRLIRRMVFRFTRAFIAASEGGQKLFSSYGVPATACFYSWLCADNLRFSPATSRSEPMHDFIFCGRLEPAKDPVFALSVARETAVRLRRKTSLLLVGSGSLESTLRHQAKAESATIDVHFYGFAQQAELPALYQSARIFLFPTHGDVWGVVANEACAAGLPVIATPEAGVAGELVVNGANGYVRTLDTAHWSACAQRLLSDTTLWQDFSTQSLQRVARYDFDSAAQGIHAACNHALQRAAHMSPTASPPEKLQ